MLPFFKPRPRFAENQLYSAGAFIGAPTKIAMANAALADGARPQEQAAAEWENWWRNDVDVASLAHRQFQWNLTGIQGPLATTVTSIRRHAGIILGVLASPGFYFIYDSTTQAPVVINYPGEGAALPKFEAIGEPDATSGGWLAVGYYAAAPTTTAFGVWSIVNPDAAVPTMTPFLGLGPYAAPTVAGKHRLVLAKGGKAYTFDGVGSVNFAEINNIATQTWTNRLGVVGMRPALTSILAGGRVNGADVICCVESSTGAYGGALRATVQTPSTGANATTTTLLTTVPLSICYVPEIGQFLFLDDTGAVYAVDPTTAGVANIGAPTLASSLAKAHISEMGWLGRCNDGKTVLYSYDFQTTRRLPALANTAILFDGEAWWIADSGAAFTYSRTQVAIP